MNSSSQTLPLSMGTKRTSQEEEKKGGLDVRDLVGRFRSKADIYEYLSQHRKLSFICDLSIVGGYYLPPKKKITKDFLKEVFAGRKSLIPYAQLRPIDVPHYDELSVVNLLDDAMAQASLAKFFPD